MEYSLGPALPNIFASSFGSRWLRDCPDDFKPVFYEPMNFILMAY